MRTKNRKKAIFIIPGYKHKPKNNAYKALAKVLKGQGYFPVPVTIPWQQTTISQNTQFFLKEYKKIRSKKKYILGFSFGAMIAFLASTKVSVSGLILCSLSPYFKEDVSKINHNMTSSLMVQRYQDFSTLHCATLAKQIKAKQILLLYGAREEKSLIKRVQKAYRHIRSSHKYLFRIQEAEHNIGDKRYLHTLHQIAKQLH